MGRFVPMVALSLSLAGCLPEGTRSLLVPESPFGARAPIPPAPAPVAYSPAAQVNAARVDSLGRRLLAANPQMGLKPQFVTIGSPQAEIFHRGTSELDITEGLVNQCTTESQLAAVLCHEFGKMVAEREALTPPRARQAMTEPPPDVRIGDSSNSYGDVTMTALAEQAKFHPPAYRAPSGPLPDPEVLARDFLTRAGYPPADLNAVAPLLKAARGNTVLEKQLVAPAPTRPWVH